MDHDAAKNGIEIKLFSGDVTFKSLEQARKFFAYEATAWKDFITKQAEASRNTNDNYIQSFLGRMITEVENQQLPAINSITAELNAVSSLADARTILEAFRIKRVILAQSARGQKILDLSNTDPITALFLLSSWHPDMHAEGHIKDGVKYPTNTMKRLHAHQTKAGVISHLFDSNITGVAEAEKSLLEAVKKQLNDTLSETHRQLDEYERIVKGIADFNEENHTRYETLISEKHERSEGLIKKQIQTLKEIKRRYTEELSLQIPVTYWNKKADDHQLAAYIWGTCFIASAVCVVLFSGTFLQHLITNVTPMLKELGGNQWSVFFIITFPAFLVVWALRMVSRNVMMNFNHMHDARNRKIMTETFLALMSENKATENDRILILNALFQPINLSSAEDHAPPHWFELMMERVKK